MTDRQSHMHVRPRRRDPRPASLPGGASFGRHIDRPPRAVLIGGPDVHLRADLVRQLRESFEITVLGSRRDSEPVFRDMRVAFQWFPLHAGISPAREITTLMHLRRILKEIDPDLVHTFATKPCVWGRLAATGVGVPVVIGTIAGLGELYATRNWKTRLLRWLYQPLQRAACKRSSLTIFQNPSDLRDFVSSGVAPVERASVISGSGIKTDVFDPARYPDELRAAKRRELGIGPDDVVVTMVSRLVRSKGVLDFSAAAETLRTEGPRCVFLLVGPADLHGGLGGLTPLELDRVRATTRWIGAREDVAQILAASDVFVLPSRYREGVPRVLLEAASMGLPLVTTPVPGCEDVVEDGHNGFLARLDVPGALAACIDALVSEPELRRAFGARSRRIAVERFDLRLVTKATIETYWSLLETSRIRSSPQLIPHG